LKARKGFINDPVQLEKAISLPVPRERVTADVLEAIRRQVDAMDKSSGKRHLCVLFTKAPWICWMIRRTSNLCVTSEGITMHGVCPHVPEKCEGFRDLCLAPPNATFHASSIDKLGDELEET
jgi:hypothetical protein